MIRRSARVVAGLPLLGLAYVLADLGAYDFAWRVREWARAVAGLNTEREEMH